MTDRLVKEALLNGLCILLILHVTFLLCACFQTKLHVYATKPHNMSQSEERIHMAAARCGRDAAKCLRSLLKAVENGDANVEKQTECSCAPCRSFWRRAFHEGGEAIQQASSARSYGTATLGNARGLMKKGDRVLVGGSALGRNGETARAGTVQFVGVADDHIIAPEMHVGVCLYDNVYSTHNGVYKGKRYFSCPRGHGAMVRYTDVTPLNPIPRTRPIVGNDMFPSFEEVKKRRKLREEKIRNAEEKLRREHEEKRRAQMERFSKSAPHPRISPRQTKASKMRVEKTDDKNVMHVQDADDIAYKDYLAREKQKQARFLDPRSLEEQQFRQMKKAFGGDEKAERMAETLMKLRKAYDEGRIIALAERD